MDKQISKGLKIVFLIHFIIGLIFGLIYLFIPELYGQITSWPVKDPTMFRLVGAAILGFTTSSWLAYKNPLWDRVKIIVIMEIVWTVLATLAMLWGMLFAGLPAMGWVNIIMMAAFAVAFIYFYNKEKE